MIFSGGGADDGDASSSVVSAGAAAAAAAAAHAALTPEAFLQRIFFIIDRTACKSEEDPPQDMILYFYPPEVRAGTPGQRGACACQDNPHAHRARTPRTYAHVHTQMGLEHQLFLIGACSSMLEFTRNFTTSAVRVLTLERSKMAVKETGPYVLVRAREAQLVRPCMGADGMAPRPHGTRLRAGPRIGAVGAARGAGPRGHVGPCARARRVHVLLRNAGVAAAGPSSPTRQAAARQAC